MTVRSSLARHWRTPRTAEEEAAAIRDMQRIGLERHDFAVIRLSAVGSDVIREAILQEARKQAGIGGRNG